jgi:hypothetical protein
MGTIAAEVSADGGDKIRAGVAAAAMEPPAATPTSM